jgi:hypothetical protein
MGEPELRRLNSVKAHKATLVEREQELIARESVLASLEAAQHVTIAMKDGEIASLQAQLTELTASIPAQMEQAVAYREQELRNAVLDYEKVVELRVQRREQEIMEAVRVREAEMCEAWQSHETALRAAFQAELEERWRAEQETLERMREEIEEKTRALEESQRKGAFNYLECNAFSRDSHPGTGQKKDKTPLEEVKNILAPLAQLAKDPQSTPRPNMTSPTRASRRLFETPTCRGTPRAFPIESAMKGVILTTTGEPLPTPTPSARLVELLNESPRVGAGGSLGFAKIFDFDKLDDEDEDEELERRVGGTSPSKRKADAIAAQTQAQTQAQGSVVASAPTINGGKRSPSKRKSVGASARSVTLPVPTRSAPAPPSQPVRRLRRPSVSSRTRAKAPADTSEPRDTTAIPAQPPSSASTASTSSASSSSSSSSSTRTVTSDAAAPTYDLKDEENLPSPFLRRVEREPSRAGATTLTRVKRPSGANMLRVAAAANNAKAAGGSAGNAKGASSLAVGSAGRSSVVRRAGEEARRTLLRM